jgi:predicted regulator of Ras-like GTPase activity (Roadblock/LC7/MglB family)
LSVAVAAPWVEQPLRRFVEDARVLHAVVLAPSGQVLGQHGFTRAMDVMSACALSAAIHASAGELGRQLEGQPFRGLHHAGREKQIFLSSTDTPSGTLLLLTVFDQETSLGLVQLYFGELCAALREASPGAEAAGVLLPENFERDLNRSLAALFGRAQPR